MTPYQRRNVGRLSYGPMRLLARLVTPLAGLAVAALALPPAALAHGDAILPPLTFGTALTSWAFEPLVVAGLLIGLVAYLAAVRRVDRAHPTTPVPWPRIAAWGAGLAVIFIALSSAIDIYSDALFSVHMIQHLLLTLVAAPLLALGAPVTLLLRAASPQTRRRRILPLLDSRLVQVISHPAVAWVLFVAVMFGSHFSALYEASLENPAVHIVEHLIYLASGYLFWAPVVGADPSRHRLSYPIRLGYVFLQMPMNAFLSLAITQAPDVLYRHYATLQLGWGPGPLEDQHLAGGLMMTGGDLLILGAMLLVVWAWLIHEEAEGRRIDDVLARRRSAELADAVRRDRA